MGIDSFAVAIERFNGPILVAHSPMQQRSAMNLDERVARIFGDNEPTRFGSGWMSGTTSVFLGIIATGGVACFHLPATLTSPEIRALLPLPWVRALIEGVIGLGFLLGLASTLLRHRKVLGFAGMAMALAASLAGGGRVPTAGSVASLPIHLGLDWFLINILLLAVIFVPLERLWPLRCQSVFRPGWTVDTHFLFFSVHDSSRSWIDRELERSGRYLRRQIAMKFIHHPVVGRKGIN